MQHEIKKVCFGPKSGLPDPSDHIKPSQKTKKPKNPNNFTNYKIEILFRKMYLYHIKTSSSKSLSSSLLTDSMEDFLEYNISALNLDSGYFAVDGNLPSETILP